MESYVREYDFFSEAAQICQLQCERLLEGNGIRAIITARAKRPDRLYTKLQRRKVHKVYTTNKDVYGDIIDLAGVRIALYFPSERDKVDTLLKQHFATLRASKKFPEDSKVTQDLPFGDYKATHYLLTLKSESLTELQKRS
jgi:ppGpp synthetase/RelA/SpoT-type nucleotidyltranferase